MTDAFAETGPIERVLSEGDVIFDNLVVCEALAILSPVVCLSLAKFGMQRVLDLVKILLSDDLEATLVLCSFPLSLSCFSSISVPLLLGFFCLVIVSGGLVIPLWFPLLTAILGLCINIEGVPIGLSSALPLPVVKWIGSVVDSVQTLDVLGNRSNLAMPFVVDLDRLMAAESVSAQSVPQWRYPV